MKTLCKSDLPSRYLESAIIESKVELALRSPLGADEGGVEVREVKICYERPSFSYIFTRDHWRS